MKTPALLFIYIKKIIKDMFMVSILKYLHDYLQIAPHLPSLSTFPLPFQEVANSSSWQVPLHSDEQETGDVQGTLNSIVQKTKDCVLSFFQGPIVGRRLLSGLHKAHFSHPDSLWEPRS